MDHENNSDYREIAKRKTSKKFLYLTRAGGAVYSLWRRVATTE